MQTVRGYFNGTSIGLLEEIPVADEAYVLVTFLEGSMETAAARGQRMSFSNETRHNSEIYSEELRKQMDSQYRRHTIGAIMTRRVISVLPTAKVADALQMMRMQGITSVLVEPDSSGEWGIMTMRDLLKQVVAADRTPEEIEVAEIATKPVESIPPDTSLADCSKLLIEKGIRRVVVCQDDQYVGIVSDTDIFQIIEEHGWEVVRADEG